MFRIVSCGLLCLTSAQSSEYDASSGVIVDEKCDLPGTHRMSDNDMSEQLSMRRGHAMLQKPKKFDTAVRMDGFRESEEQMKWEEPTWGNKKPKPSGERKKRRMLFRPMFTKSLRCSDSTAESCEECTTSTDQPMDCWGPVMSNTDVRQPTQVKVTPGTQTWKRFLWTVHLQCHAPAVTMRIRLHRLMRGKFSLFFDGQEISEKNGHQLKMGKLKRVSVRKKKGNDWKQLLPSLPGSAKGNEDLGARIMFKVPLEDAGLHELQIQYEPDEEINEKQMASIKSLYLFMADEVLKCEDWKTCLGVLGGGSDKSRLITARELRNSNELQLACLKEQSLESYSKDLQSICNEWRDCVSTRVDGRSKLEELVALLEAANVSHVGKAPRPQQGDTVRGCIHPPTEDPEAWDCSCYDNMLQRCELLRKANSTLHFTTAQCLHSQYCLYPGVCDHWKATECNDLKTQAIQEAMSSLSTLLVQVPIQTRPSHESEDMDKGQNEAESEVEKDDDEQAREELDQDEIENEATRMPTTHLLQRAKSSLQARDSVKDAQMDEVLRGKGCA